MVGACMAYRTSDCMGNGGHSIKPVGVLSCDSSKPLCDRLNHNALRAIALGSIEKNEVTDRQVARP